MRLRLLVAPQLDQRLGQVVARRGVVGRRVHGLLVRRDRLFGGARVERVVPALDVEALPRRQRLGARDRLLRVLASGFDVAQVGRDHRELGERHREAGIGFDRLLEMLARLALLEPLVEAVALGVGLVGLDRGGRDVLQLPLLLVGPVREAHERRRLELLADAVGEVVDQPEQAALGVALDALGRDHLARARVLQARLDPDPRSRAHEAADDGGRGLRLPRHRGDGLPGERAVVAVAALVEDLVEPLGAEHAQLGGLRQVGDQHVGEAGAQPVEAGLARDVVEVENSERAAAVVRGGGGAAVDEERRHHAEHDERGQRRDRQRPAAPAGDRRHQAAAARRRAEHHLARVHVALEVLEVAAQVGRGLVAVLGPLLERALDHARERLRDVVAQLAHRAWRVLQDRRQHRHVGVAAERPLAGRHLVEQDPEREDVGAVVERQALRLLRRHVGDRAHDAPVLGDGLRLLGGVVARIGVVAQLGEAEVEHLEPPVRREHHVLGLQVAVQDALAVRRAHGVGECDREREEALHREAARGDLLAERLALDELHRQEAQAVRFLDRVQHHDAGMAERGDRLRLALEALDLLRVERHLRRQHLERHAPVEARIEREVHLTHAARAERLEDLVRADTAADQAAIWLHLTHDGDYDATNLRPDPGVTSVHMIGSSCSAG